MQDRERVLVTGGAGFIGSHTCERMVARGHEVLCLDNFDPFYDRAIKHQNLAQLREAPAFTLLEGDLCDPSVLEEAFAWKPTILVHLAALAGVRPSIAEPVRYAKVNVEGTCRLLEKCVQQDVRRVVFASSSSVYGNRMTIPFRESDRVDDPVSPYAATKKAGELICYTFAHLHQMDIACLRFFTVYGPRQRPEMAIHKFVRAVLDGVPITLFGDGSSSRDYTYIDDVVDGIEGCMSTLKGYQVFNLGNSTPTRLDELVDIIEQVTGCAATRQHISTQAGDVDRTFADISHAAATFGYSPQVPVREGVERFVAWLEGHGVAPIKS